MKMKSVLERAIYMRTERRSSGISRRRIQTQRDLSNILVGGANTYYESAFDAALRFYST